MKRAVLNHVLLFFISPLICIGFVAKIIYAGLKVGYVDMPVWIYEKITKEE